MKTIGTLVILLIVVAIASLSPVLATRQEPPKYTPTATIECVCAPPVTPFSTATYTKRRQ